MWCIPSEFDTFTLIFVTRISRQMSHPWCQSRGETLLPVSVNSHCRPIYNVTEAWHWAVLTCGLRPRITNMRLRSTMPFLPCVTTWNPAYHTCSWPFAALDDITHFGLLTADGAPTQRFIYLPNPSGVWREQGEKCKVRLQWRCSKQSTKYTRKLHLHTLTVHSVSVRVFSLYSWQI